MAGSGFPWTVHENVTLSFSIDSWFDKLTMKIGGSILSAIDETKFKFKLKLKLYSNQFHVVQLLLHNKLNKHRLNMSTILEID